MEKSKESQELGGGGEENREGRSFFVNNLIKVGVFAVISLAALLGTLFVEGVLFEGEVVEQVEDRMVVRFVDGGFDFDEGGRVVFEPGRYWVNLAAVEGEVLLLVGEVLLLDSNRAVFELVYEENGLELNVFDGDVRLFLVEGSGLINELLVPRFSRVRVPFRKVDERLRSLLPNKLKKEIFYSALPAGVFEDSFVKDNLQKDLRFLNGLKQGFRTEVAARGGGSDFGFLNLMANVLTFIPDRRQELKLAEVFAYLDEAIFLAGENDREGMRAAMRAYDLGVSGLELAYRQGETYGERVLAYLNDLSIFNFNDLEFEVYLALLEKSGVASVDVLIDLYWNNVYKGLDVSTGEAHRAFDLYLANFTRLVSVDSVDYRRYLEEQNQLFDNLFLRFADFYRDGYFALKEELEGKLLEFYEGRDAEEMKQAFLDNKIDFLRRLRSHFFEGVIDNAETKKVFKRLMNGAKNLLPREGSTVAVIELFERRLSDIDDFWGYLSSSEYQSDFYGSGHQERYEAYLKERREVFGFLDIRREVFGEVVEAEVSEAEVSDEVVSALEGKFGISGVVVNDFEDVKDRYVKVNAVVGGYPFEAVFDRYSGVIADVYVYGELISDRAIKPSNLFALVVERFADFDEGELVDEDLDFTVETVAQRRARLYVAETLVAVGFSVGLEDVRVLFEDEAVYKVEGASLGEDSKVKVSFDIRMTGEVVSNLFMSVRGKPQVVNGEFSLEEVFKLADAERRFLELGDGYDPDVLLGRKPLVPRGKLSR